MMNETQLAPYAAQSDTCRGRLHAEQESAHRSPFQRDRDRIIHSSAFRRLKHKTQVFVEHEGDYYRTRLTHSIEVAQIARTIARTLRLNEDLAETLALAHDLGHTPFGHAGEEALDALLVAHGGFDHNAQTLRIVTRLEHRYAGFPGLNLTWETLEGVVKHNGPLIGPHIQRSSSAVPAAITDYVENHDLEIHTFAGPEAQLTALADDIAYNNHDLDDGLRAGLFEVDDLLELPVVGPVFEAQRRAHPDLTPQQLHNEAIRRLIAHMVNDLLAETGRRLKVDTSPLVEVTHRCDPAGQFEWIALYNHSGRLENSFHPPIPISNVRLSLQTSRPIKRITSLTDGARLARADKSTSEMQDALPRLDVFDVVLVEYER